MRIREVSVKYQPSQIPLQAGEKYTTSRQVYEAFREDLMGECVEVFRVVFLDGKNQLLGFEDVSRGSLTSSVVHPREVFWSAVHMRAAGIICLHNHPSGDPKPSSEDVECTRRLYRASQILGIKLLDHIILGHSSYFSFADEQRLGGAS